MRNVLVALFLLAQGLPAVAQHRPVVHTFLPKSAGALVTGSKTTILGSRATITASVDLGSPIVRPVPNADVIGAPLGLTFSRLEWPKASSLSLPPGVTLTESHVAERESIPGLEFTLAVPASASTFSSRILNPRWQSTTANFLPTARSVGDSAVTRYTTSYSLPVESVRWSKPRTFRTLRSVTVWIPLIKGNGSDRSVLTKFDIAFSFAFDPSTLVAAQHDRLFAAANHALVFNSSDLDRFEVPLRPTGLPSTSGKHTSLSADADFVPADTGSWKWIDPSATYLKFTLTRDGVYRVTAEHLRQGPAQFDLEQQGWKSGNVRLIHRGIEVPIAVDSDANGRIGSITFYGERLRGPGSEYYNNYTDSSAYFLTTAGSGPVKRYRPHALDPARATPVAAGDVTLHHERDLFYYVGDKVFYEPETTNRTETVSGERFNWFQFHGPTSNDSARLTDTFYVSSLPANTNGRSARFHFFLRGISVDTEYPNDPNHHVRIRLNGEEIAESFFRDWDSVAVEPLVPLSKLHLGANVVTIVSAGTRATNDYFYLDYYDVRFESGLSASTDSSITRGQWDFIVSNSDPVIRFTTLPSDAAVLNLSDTSILGTPFVDSVEGNAHYVGATPASMLRPAEIEKITNWSVLDTRNAADYLIITHPNFRHAADLLKVRRSLAGLRSLVVDVRDVYNAFGYGSDDPEALRRFLSYAYYHYSGLPVSMVTLFGDGSWDPKLNQNNEYFPPGDRSNQHSFIQTFGNPVSDFYFTLSDAGKLDTLQPKMLIARIAVSKAEEADAYVTKLVDYESQAPAEWSHNFLYTLGGDELLHRIFLQQAKSYLSADGVGLSLPPSNIRGSFIERTDFGGSIDLGHVGEIQTAVREGRSLFYFTGHGATFISDIQLGDPTLWRNKQKYPVFITLSCRTGAFAEPNQVSVNEAFMRTNEGGVIMAFGTTGFGEVTYDAILSAKLFELMRSYPKWHDTSVATMMNLTQLFTLAKLYASDSGGVGIIGLNTRLQYSILGDAALGFALRPQPEFVERATDIQTFDHDGRPATTVRVADTTMQVTAIVHNVGFSAERPVVVRFRDAGPKGLPTDVFDTLSRLDTTASLAASFALSKESVGEHTITVTIDPGNDFLETHEEDNEATATVLVSGISVTPFFPYEGGVGICDITASVAHAILLVPRTEDGMLTGKIELQLDTTVTFSHAWHGDVPTGSNGYVEYDLPLSQVSVPSSGVYWWRSRLVPNTGDPTDWEVASFSAEPQSDAGFAYVSSDQLQRSIVAGLKLTDEGALYLPQHDTVVYDVVSVGARDTGVGLFPYSVISINGRPAYEYGNIGFALAELTVDGSALDTVYEFIRSNDAAAQDSLVALFDSVVRSIPEGRRVIVFTNWQPYMDRFASSPIVQQDIESLGGKMGFSQVLWFESYVLIGAKGMASGAAREKHSGYAQGPTELLDTTVTLGTSGIAEFPSTAVALRYSTLSWEGPAVPAGTDIQFSLIGRRVGATRDEVVQTHKASESRSFDLSSIDPHMYSRLFVRATLQRTSSSEQSPQLSGIRLTYEPAPELVFDPDSIETLPSIVPEGATVVAHYTIHALTCAPADNIGLVLARSNKGSLDSNFRTIAHLDGHSSSQLTDTLQTLGEQGDVQLTATIDPAHLGLEQLLFNDQISGIYVVGRDTATPHSEILVDDRHLPPYGYASGDPWITVNLISKGVIRQTDSLSISARFLREDASADFVTVTAGNPGNFRVVFEPNASGGVQASLRFQPLTPLAPGQYQIAAYAHDASGNVADTIYQTFTVSAENGIEHVMNYPNPFKGETDFTFVLRNDAKADVKIIVYTVAGHKLRTLRPLSTHAGVNIAHWDGRDEAGNELANGTYLYRVVLNTSDASGKDVIQGVTEKAVLAR